MDAVQERSRGTILTEVVELMVVHHRTVRLRSTLRISRLERNSRMDHGDRGDLVISKNECGSGDPREQERYWTAKAH